MLRNSVFQIGKLKKYLILRYQIGNYLLQKYLAFGNEVWEREREHPAERDREREREIG